MKTNLARRVITSGLRGFYRNRTVSLSSIFILTITLSIITAFYLFRAISSRIRLIRSQKRWTCASISPQTQPKTQINDVKARIVALPQVKTVTYTTREQALEDFRTKHAGDQLTLQALDELGTNPFGASLSVVAKDTSQYQAIADQLSSDSGLLGGSQASVDKINYYQLKDSIDKLNNIIGWTNTVGFWLTMVFILMSCMIVYNTIRLAIFVYRDEISVMKLVGASNMFIRGPFVVEAILYAFTATVVTLIIYWPATIWVTKKTVFFFEGMNIHSYFTSHIFQLIGLLLLSGMVLSVISSLLAVRKYLKI
jgi:cell division transport system permease protein